MNLDKLSDEQLGLAIDQERRALGEARNGLQRLPEAAVRRKPGEAPLEDKFKPAAEARAAVGKVKQGLAFLQREQRRRDKLAQAVRQMSGVDLAALSMAELDALLETKRAELIEMQGILRPQIMAILAERNRRAAAKKAASKIAAMSGAERAALDQVLGANGIASAEAFGKLQKIAGE